MTLEEYLRNEYAKRGAIDFRIRAFAWGDEVTFYIHAADRDSNTADFIVKGNELETRTVAKLSDAE